MKTVHKTVLELDFSKEGAYATAEAELPAGAEIVRCATQGDDICIWYVCEPENRKERRYFRVVPTGGDLGEDRVFYLGTFVTEGFFVWHAFETLSN